MAYHRHPEQHPYAMNNHPHMEVLETNPKLQTSACWKFSILCLIPSELESCPIFWSYMHIRWTDFLAVDHRPWWFLDIVDLIESLKTGPLTLLSWSSMTIAWLIIFQGNIWNILLPNQQGSEDLPSLLSPGTALSNCSSFLICHRLVSCDKCDRASYLKKSSYFGGEVMGIAWEIRARTYKHGGSNQK